jgi:glycine/D-amino acid oxidase-like deaminating enzyme
MAPGFLIIGQGLAGSLLAWELIQRGCNVVIIDNGENNASKVAAGLINPVAGMRFVKSQDADTFLPIAQNYYARLSDCFQQPFYFEKPMLRLFRSKQESDLCIKRLSDPGYRQYLGDVHPAGKKIDSLETPLGYLEQKQTGYLLTKTLLAELTRFFIAKGCYRQAGFDYRDLRFRPSLRWRDLYPEQIIFCEGFRAIYNPWFLWLPMQPVKGEILTLERPGGFPECIINYGHWLLPVDNHRIRIGATFDRGKIDTETTETGKGELLASASHVFANIMQSGLMEHQAGIRPCTMDRQPFIGRHPYYRQLNIFNGFGAKGGLLIPVHCRRFADFLLTGMPLPGPCDIQRYHATHFIA